MPGNIFKVECSVGQSVNAGDVLIVLEAMKIVNITLDRLLRIERIFYSTTTVRPRAPDW